jgi:hypothetical protein
VTDHVAAFHATSSSAREWWCRPLELAAPRAVKLETLTCEIDCHPIWCDEQSRSEALFIFEEVFGEEVYAHPSIKVRCRCA